jgi:hypothetical protein
MLFALFFNPYESFSSITYPNFPLNRNTSLILVQGMTVEGKFTAKENNLGTILLKFPNIPVLDYQYQDTLVFRLKEADSASWYIQNKYRSGIFMDSPTFPFGFPRLPDSKGKNYVFQLESKAGGLANAVTVGNTFDIRYILDKSQLFHSPQLLFGFVLKKVYVSIFDIDFLLNSFIYLTPLLLYGVWLILNSKQSKKTFSPIFKRFKDNKQINFVMTNVIAKGRWVLVTILVIIFVYSLLTKVANIGISVFIIGWWILAIFKKIVTSRVSFIFFTILLSLGFLGIMLSQINFSTRISSWAYIFLLIGAIQAIFEEKKTV